MVHIVVIGMILLTYVLFNTIQYIYFFHKVHCLLLVGKNFISLNHV